MFLNLYFNSIRFLWPEHTSILIALAFVLLLFLSQLTAKSIPVSAQDAIKYVIKTS